MAMPSTSFYGTEGKDNVDEESDDEVLLIELIFQDREATSSPCLFVNIVRYRAAYI